MEENLYALSKLILRSFPNCFVRIDPHDPNDSEHVDRLWTDHWDGEPNGPGEGTVLTVAPAGESSYWIVCYEDAIDYGGWATIWSMVGDMQEVIDGIQDAFEPTRGKVLPKSAC